MPLPPALLELATFALTLVGLVVGSFLNVVVWRVPRGESIVHPGSHCPRCGAAIEALDNVPVLSWLLLGRRCRHCLGPISWRYPVVETLTCVCTYLVVAHDGLVAVLPFHLAFTWIGVALALIDLDTFLLPLVLTLPLIALGIGAGAVGTLKTLEMAALGAAIGWALIVVVGKIGELIAGREAMGGGDAILMAGIGAFVGPWRLLLVLGLASIQGVVLGLIHLRRRHAAEAGAQANAPTEPEPPQPAEPIEAKPASEDDEDDWVPDASAIPFGPFLVLGAYEVLLWGDAMVRAMHLGELVDLLPAIGS